MKLKTTLFLIYCVTSHIIAISGLNIAIVSGLFTRSFGRILGPYKGGPVALIAMTVYTILVGADAAIVRAGLNAQLNPNPEDMKWSKMITNLVSNASSAILDMTPAEIFSNPGLYRMENRQIREALSVMQALNIKPINLPGTPVRLLVFAIQQLPLVISRSILAKAVGGGRGGKMPSFHIDLHAGRKKSEVDFLNGAVVRMA
jgi:ketopantoate reductase